MLLKRKIDRCNYGHSKAKSPIDKIIMERTIIPSSTTKALVVTRGSTYILNSPARIGTRRGRSCSCGSLSLGTAQGRGDVLSLTALPSGRRIYALWIYIIVHIQNEMWGCVLKTNLKKKFGKILVPPPNFVPFHEPFHYI